MSSVYSKIKENQRVDFLYFNLEKYPEFVDILEKIKNDSQTIHIKDRTHMDCGELFSDYMTNEITKQFYSENSKPEVLTTIGFSYYQKI